MNYLVGDIGNTSTKICLISKSSKIIKEYSVETKKLLIKKKIEKEYFFLPRTNATTRGLDRVNARQAAGRPPAGSEGASRNQNRLTCSPHRKSLQVAGLPPGEKGGGIPPKPQKVAVGNL